MPSYMEILVVCPRCGATITVYPGEIVPDSFMADHAWGGQACRFSAKSALIEGDHRRPGWLGWPEKEKERHMSKVKTLGKVEKRIGREERDLTIDALREHLDAERITVTEFEERMSAAMEAHTQAELDRLTRDLPSLPKSQPPPQPGAPGGDPWTPVELRHSLRFPVRLSSGWLFWGLFTALLGVLLVVGW